MSKGDGSTGVNNQSNNHSNNRRERIEDLQNRVQMAKKDAQELGLRFEAYLLDIAIMAFAERLQRSEPD